jgi:peptidoglycan/xylan/chitin deacetylase (PgdA/CDA1 family)
MSRLPPALYIRHGLVSPTPFLDRIQGFYQRHAARALNTRPLTLDLPAPIVSFTFDDFPRSALLTGGAILEQFGLRGTYYASFGLMGLDAPTGPIFVRKDLPVLAARGHELGCHTFDHCHSWNTTAQAFERSIIVNRTALEELMPGAAFRTFSYPISPPQPRTKRVVGGRFSCARGGGQTFNVGTTDLNYLRAYFLEKTQDRPDDVQRVIDANRAQCGWLVLATHDVCKAPTPFGCTPGFFEDVVRRAVDSGARILPVAEALDSMVLSDRRAARGSC